MGHPWARNIILGRYAAGDVDRGKICDLICSRIITGNIKVSLGCSETSAQAFLSLPHNLTIALTYLIINTSMVMNQKCCI